ncbi:hypothetical protein OHB41_03655 [Streptomyces sp. NBC_01571]|uniref:hypothetical protein n=1 Tax=Streptomyces sp. NBC_01571 TaxID=2975883 RepID=UPI002253FD30|nr:hypothetical protein [Streptomyces sp. NBC_01571]MCX4572294.1 hypothetical protein [Streptomyces sp. NBC_01571]
MTMWQPGMAVSADRLNDGPPTIVEATGFTIASGWDLNDFSMARAGSVVELNLYVHRSGTTLTITGTANLNDTLVGTVPAEWCPTRGTINGTWDDGTAEGGFVIGTDGIVTLRTSNGEAIVGDATSAGNGRNLRLHIVFIQ